MGRWSYGGKTEADGLKSVSVFSLNKHKYFDTLWMSGTITWSKNGEMTGSISIQSNVTDSEKHVRFIYTQTDRSTGEKTDFDYKIPLTTTSCYFGGVRYWFQCPWYANGVYCGRRVGVLYLGDKYFACRHCYRLTYNSRNFGGLSKLAGQVISIPDLEKMESEVKRKYYRGKTTRKYRRFLKKEWKSMRQLQIMAAGLGAIK
jgi:hypothetical protein